MIPAKKICRQSSKELISIGLFPNLKFIQLWYVEQEKISLEYCPINSKITKIKIHKHKPQSCSLSIKHCNMILSAYVCM